MSKPIKPVKLTEDMVEILKIEFADYLTNKVNDGKIAFSKTISQPVKAEKAYVNFTAAAFAKMTMLIQYYSSEVAWHGVVHRSETEDNVFTIEDILVYPQVVTGTTVKTDQIPYQTWLYEHDDDIFNNIRMQGHSHPNFSTSPSTTDLAHQGDILKQMCDDDYYIFMIWNKKFERTITIYDMKNNTLYENADIVVKIGEEGLNLDAFIQGTKEMVKCSHNQTSNAGSKVLVQGNTAAANKTDTQPVTQTPAQKPIGVNTSKTSPTDIKPKEKPKTTVIGRGWSGMPRNYSYDGYDYDDYYGYHQ